MEKDRRYIEDRVEEIFATGKFKNKIDKLFGELPPEKARNEIDEFMVQKLKLSEGIRSISSQIQTSLGS